MSLLNKLVFEALSEIYFVFLLSQNNLISLLIFCFTCYFFLAYEFSLEDFIIIFKDAKEGSFLLYPHQESKNFSLVLFKSYQSIFPNYG